MSRCRILTTVMLVLAVARPATEVAAQQGQLTSAQIAQIKKDVAAAVHTYYRLFTERNMVALGEQVYHSPWLQLGATGIEVDETPADVTKRFDASLKRLLESGWDRSEFANPVVCVLNGGAAIASGTFKRYRKDGSVISENGITYLFGKTSQGWRIVSFAGHAANKLVTCND
jgi:hypothetical protein